MRRPPARELLRHALLRVGRHLPPVRVADLRAAYSYVELGGWLAEQGLAVPPAYPTVADLFAVALRHVTGSRPLYLEFGVYRGASLRWWSEHLPGEAARLVGFDSFVGLPEDWRPGQPAGHFATGGPPVIDDPRVSFQVGWFADTLAGFTPPEHDQLVVNVDCDLYSSAATVLAWLEPHLRPGDLLYFDELPDHDHELRAFGEFLTRSGGRVSPLGIAEGGLRWLFRWDGA